MMKHEYDVIIAENYAAYRPPLHDLILKKCLKGYQKSKFKLGLDVGCGTGQSSVALTGFCEKVIAIDPSPEMLVMAKSNRRISYKSFDGKNLDFPDDQFDIVTFAGSLFYAKSQRLFDETLRVTKRDGLILIYDFEIMMDEFQRDLGILVEKSLEGYDHWLDLSGLDTYGISKLFTQKERIKIQVSPKEMTHLLLAEYGVYQALLSKYPDVIPFDMVYGKLKNLHLQELPVDIFYTLYKTEK
ncbi:class I SAM-dependent methyltransferase [Aquiflexum lacus]|uniref:class I SAM-dependent methyltransferase n=1 Tax=Aquiflexum lacus TaxID=2483805 RepID=UPI00189310AF|nr:class I SAM-dependent methyltransferase [Aquiflexum lacus]